MIKEERMKELAIKADLLYDTGSGTLISPYLESFDLTDKLKEFTRLVNEEIKNETPSNLSR